MPRTGKKKKPPIAPLVLRRLFKNGVKSLGETIISVLPPPEASRCRCKGRRGRHCLGCISTNKAMFHLVKPTDSWQYRKLLRECFVVVSQTATEYSEYDPASRWNQSQIVTRTIMKISEKRSANVICADYDKATKYSKTVELLTSPAWKLLLKRVGDSLMCYLLENTLIFLPLAARGQYRQVSGLSIKGLTFAAIDLESNSNHNRSANGCGFEKKLKRTNEAGNNSTGQQASSPWKSSFPLHSSTCIGCSPKQSIAQFDSQRSNIASAAAENNIVSAAAGNAGEKHIPSTCIGCSPKQSIAQFDSQRSNIASAAAENAGYEKHIPCGQHSSNGTVRSRKKRPFRWQRQRNHFSRTFPLGPCREGALYKFQALQACSCCSAFQYLPNVNEDRLNRQILLYKMENCSSAFPRSHIFNSIRSDFKGANALLNQIFGNCWPSTASGATPCSHSINICKMKSKCLYHSLIKLLKILINNAKNFQLSKLLDKHCPVPSFETRNESACITKGHFDVQSSSQSTPYEAQYGKANLYSSHKQVTTFTWAVCRRIVPPDLLGDPSNRRKLRMNISRFIRLRRFENFSLKECMHELKISKIPLLYDKHSSCDLSGIVDWHSGGFEANRGNSGVSVECDKIDRTYFVKHKIFKCWIYWFFSCLVVPLLQANFYVTESEGGKQELFYYRKPVWEKVVSEAVTSLEDHNFDHLNDKSLRDIARNRSFGYSKARLCPKGSGVRVLANLKAPSKIPSSSLPSKVLNSMCGSSASTLTRTEYQVFKSVNKVLRSSHAILKGVQMKLPGKLGSSTFDYNDVYKRLVPFISLVRNGGNSIPKIYIVVADVSKAFDSVDQNKLLDVVKTVLLDDEYRLSKSNKIICTKTSFYVQPLLSLTPQDGHSQPGILVNEGLNIKVKKEKIVSDLVEHIKHNILQVGDKFYLQSVGIPQGSIISALLCSFYYGHMEKHMIFPHLDEVCHSRAFEDLGKLHIENTSTSGGNYTDDVDICNSEDLLLRLIDDYLFISTSKQQATKFFSLLQEGFPEYNAFMNEKKFGSNFHMNHESEHEANRVFVGQDGTSFLKWSGLLINCKTLEIQADYSRYQDSHIKSTLTVSWKDKTHQKLRVKLCDYLRPKCHPIFYDEKINSPAVVRLNIYQVFLLCGMKFHSYVSVLFNLHKLNIKSVLESLEFSLRYMHKLIKRRNYSMFRLTSLKPSYKVEKQEIEWLGLFAYIRVLKRKESRYGSLLFFLESKLKGLPINENLSPEMKYATDDKHSSIFWKMEY